MVALFIILLLKREEGRREREREDVYWIDIFLLHFSLGAMRYYEMPRTMVRWCYPSLNYLKLASIPFPRHFSSLNKWKRRRKESKQIFHYSFLQFICSSLK